MYEVIRAIVRVFLAIAFRYSVIGREKVPATGPVILAANHSSAWDPVFVACAVDRPVSYMAKAELFRVPVLGALLPRLLVFPVRRGTADRAAVKKAIEVLRSGGVLGIFPEGTRHRDGLEHPGLPGVAYFAAKTGAVVVPVGTTLRGGFRGRAVVRFGDPVDLGHQGGKVESEMLKEWTNTVMTAIRQLVLSDGESA